MSDFWEVLISFVVMVVVAGGEYWLKKRNERREHDEYWAQKSKKRQTPARTPRTPHRASRPTAVPTDFFEPEAPTTASRSRSLDPSPVEAVWNTSAPIAEETGEPTFPPSLPTPAFAPSSAASTAVSPRDRKTETPHPYGTLLRRNCRTAVIMMEILSPPKALRKR